MADLKTYYYGLGRRKTSTVRSRLYPKGTGKLTINGISAEEYLVGNDYLISRLQKPFASTSTVGQYDVSLLVRGGGKSAQTDAMVLAMARSLAELNDDYRSTLKKAGLIKRDPREKERMKPGLKGARRAEQFSKR
jgi:small subunit ribosomal protein S9